MHMFDQAYFNSLRVSLIEAMRCFFASMLPAESEFLHSLRRWLSDDKRYLDFDRMPTLVHRDAIDTLNRYNMIGVYWFVNHHDTCGSLSRGQLYDLAYSLFKLQSYLDSQYMASFSELATFVENCNKDSAMMWYQDAPPPQQQHVSAQQHIPAQQQQLTSSTVVQGTGNKTVAAILNNIRPAIKAMVYDPAEP